MKKIIILMFVFNVLNLFSLDKNDIKIIISNLYFIKDVFKFDLEIINNSDKDIFIDKCFEGHSYGLKFDKIKKILYIEFEKKYSMSVMSTTFIAPPLELLPSGKSYMNKIKLEHPSLLKYPYKNLKNIVFVFIVYENSYNKEINQPDYYFNKDKNGIRIESDIFTIKK